MPVWRNSKSFIHVRQYLCEERIRYFSFVDKGYAFRKKLNYLAFLMLLKIPVSKNAS